MSVEEGVRGILDAKLEKKENRRMARPAGPGAPKDAATGQLGLALGPTSGPNRTMPFMEVVLKVSRVALHKLMKWPGKSPGLLGRHKI